MAQTKKTSSSAAKPKKTVKKKSAAKPKAAAASKAALSAAETQRPTPAEFSTPAPAKSNAGRRILWAVLIVALIVGIGVEVTMVLKNKINYQGKVVSVLYFGERGEMPDKIGKFWGASRIRIDDTRKRVAMVDGMFNKILYWDTLQGKHLMDLDKEGPHQVDAQGRPVVKNFAPVNGDMDAAGNMYVLDKNNAEVSIFSPEFKLKANWKVAPGDKIAVSREGLIYIMDYRTMEVVQLNAAGQEQKRFGRDMFSNPRQMAIDEAGNLFVSDLGLQKVLGFSPDGKLITSFAPRIRPFGDQDLFARGGKIYLSMYDLKHLFIYDLKGKLVWDIVLPYPGTIAVDNDGLLYLAGPGGIGTFRIEKQFQ